MPQFEKLAAIGAAMAALGAALTLPNPARAASAGETFICNFGRHGKAIINTRYPDPTFTIGGRTHRMDGGSYFYLGRDNNNIVVYFGPKMRYWDYEDVRDSKCIRRKN